MTTVTLTGISGKSYVFEVFSATGIAWNPGAGLYAFTDAHGSPKYIGETSSFVSRNPGPAHKKWAKAVSFGANLILAMVWPGGQTARKAVEADLIRAYNPPANVQKRTGAGLLTGRGFGR